MGYALFAQRKLMLTGLLNGLQLQQTQRSNEQLALATNTLSLQQQLTSLQTAQSQELAKKYEELANSGQLQTLPGMGTSDSDGTDTFVRSGGSGGSGSGSNIEKILIGDVDGDGKVEASDARQILRWEEGLDLDTEEDRKKYQIQKDAIDYYVQNSSNSSLQSIRNSAVTLKQAVSLIGTQTGYTQDGKFVGFKRPTGNTADESKIIEENTDVDGVVNYKGVTYNLNNDSEREAYEQVISDEREKIQAEIKVLEQKFKQEEDVINRQIYQVSIKENAIEMEIKRLDTKITAIQKQLEATEEAEGSGIDRATPKFVGIA